MASYSRHYTLHVTASVVMVMALPAVGVWLSFKGYAPFAVLMGILTLAAVYRLIRLLRYPISQTEMMARAIKNHDLMLHIPETDDVLLRQASADMNRILRVMTHELRNTVTPIVSLTDFMIENPDAQSEEDRREAISIINSQAHNVCSFLESYRQLTVLAQPSMTDIPVSRIFSNLQTLLKAEPGADRVRFETAGDVIIHADSSLIPLALINIIRNAIQATDGVEDGRITVMASAPGGKPCITVTNNGPEIPESQIEQIFMPFYSTKKRGSGSGIGLALSRQIMQLHEGTLTCSSHYPYTTFTFQFS